MGATVVTVSREEHGIGPVKYIKGTIVMSNSYATNGDTLDLSDYLSEIDIVQLHARGVGYSFRWDGTNKKVKAVYYDYDAGADGASIEVANAVDLSGETIDFVAFGIP